MEKTEELMNKSIMALSKKLDGIRTSRANPAMLSDIKVDYYGSKVPLEQVASVTAPENQVLMLNIFDKTAIKAIEKAILESQLGLNPSIDGSIIRIQLPHLTEERRRELVKYTKKITEEAKVSIRNIRRDAIDAIKKEEKNKDIDENTSKTHQTNVQEITDKFTKKIDTLFQVKEQEVMQI
jgi:ribosome recycling factor